MDAVSDRFRDAAAASPPAQVVLVTFTTDTELAAYQERRAVPFPILIDAERRVYAAYGLGRGSLRTVWGLRTLRRYWQILRPSGPGVLDDVGAATEDTRQLGGDIVIAPNGTVAWGHWSTGPADRPSVDDIVGAVHRAVTP